ncbi:MAG: hypothetical protein M1831_004323 [Alyxoria varia]|nr:MAG: hypothetical protein M1831_004323 [Alyxoria varia]
METPKTEFASPIPKTLLDRDVDELILQIQRAITKPLMDGYADVFRICRFLPDNCFDEIRAYDWIEESHVPVAGTESVRKTSPLARIASVFAKEDCLANMKDLRVITFHKLDPEAKRLLLAHVDKAANQQDDQIYRPDAQYRTVLKPLDKQLAPELKQLNPLGIMDFLVDNANRLGHSVVTQYCYKYELRDGKRIPTSFRIILGYAMENDAFIKVQRKCLKERERTARHAHN